MKDGENKLIRTIREWPLVVKIAAGVCVTAVIAAVILVICIVRQQRVEPVEEMVSEKKESEAVTERSSRETETEEVSEVEVNENVPSFSVCKIKTESLERNLDVFFTDKNDNPISGVAFQVKLLHVDANGSFSSKADTSGSSQGSTNGANDDNSGNEDQGDVEQNAADENSSADGTTTDSADPYAKLQKVSEELRGVRLKEDDFQKKMGSPDFPLKKYEKFLVKKKKILDRYVSLLMQVPDKLYSDEDKDGTIHVEDISGGTYALCFVPVENPRAAQGISVTAGEENSSEIREKKSLLLYDCGDYPLQVSVSGSASAQVIDHIMEKVEGNGSGDKEEKHTDIENEGKIKDTIPYTDEFSLSQESDYTKVEVDPEELQIKAEASEELIQSEGEYAEGATIAVTKSVKLFANAEKDASMVEIACQKEGVSEAELVFSDELSGFMEAEESEAGYKLSIADCEAVTGDTEGTATVVGKDSEGAEISVAFTISITGGDKKLSDSNGKLYIANKKGKIVRATVGNYRENGTYYIAKASKVVTYHGFQKKGKYWYYYDQNSKPVKGKQRIGGVNYKFDEKNGRLISAGVGIDVSSFDGDIDWEKASCCVKTALVRCGYRGTDGKLAVDTKHLTNVKGAKANGINTGMYFHSRARSRAQAVEEASLAVVLAKQAGGLQLSIYLEPDRSVWGDMSNSERTSVAKAFCDTVKNGGFKAGVSGSISSLTNEIDKSALDGVSVWCLQYSKKCSYKGSYDLWQYTNKGHVPGIAGTVNLDQMN